MFVLWFVTFECVSVFPPLYNQNQMSEFCNKTFNFNVLAFYLTPPLSVQAVIYNEAYV